jgi:nucleolar protein 15
MRAYFSQFGNIARLRLSRNKKTGASKHYAFIEFDSGEVAQIVAKTMNNYLLFGHILQVRLIPKEKVHENLFKGANQRFKVAPRNMIQGRQLKASKPKEVWDKKIKRERSKRSSKMRKLADIGYEFEAPKLRNTNDLVKEQLAIEIAQGEARALTEKPHDQPEVDIRKVIAADVSDGVVKVTETVKIKRMKKVDKTEEPSDNHEKDSVSVKTTSKEGKRKKNIKSG